MYSVLIRCWINSVQPANYSIRRDANVFFQEHYCFSDFVFWKMFPGLYETFTEFSRYIWLFLLETLSSNLTILITSWHISITCFSLKDTLFPLRFTTFTLNHVYTKDSPIPSNSTIFSVTMVSQMLSKDLNEGDKCSVFCWNFWLLILQLSLKCPFFQLLKHLRRYFFINFLSLLYFCKSSFIASIHFHFSLSLLFLYSECLIVDGNQNSSI